MSTINLTELNYKEVTDGKPKVLIDFWATWCPPCKAFGPVFLEASDKFPEIIFAKMDVDENPNFAAEHNIRSIPTLWVIKDGEVVFNQPGAMDSKALEDLIHEHFGSV